MVAASTDLSYHQESGKPAPDPCLECTFGEIDASTILFDRLDELSHGRGR